MLRKFDFRLFLIIVLILVLLCFLLATIFRPFLSNYAISALSKYTKGQYVCTLDSEGMHVGKLYKINKNQKELLRTYHSNSCIFSKPKNSTGFFVLAIGGGGGATPFESGRSGQVVSKHLNISDSILVIKVGKGGSGTYITDDNRFIDAKNGEATTVSGIKITADGGFASTRMTQLGVGVSPDRNGDYISKKYLDLYKLSADERYGAGGEYSIFEKQAQRQSK